MKGERLGEFEELVLLSIRMLSEQASSVAIQEILSDQARRSVALGAIYAAVDRLERKGHVASWLGDPTPVRGGRRKRLYKLTVRGREALADTRRVRDAMWAHSPGATPDKEAVK